MWQAVAFRGAVDKGDLEEVNATGLTIGNIRVTCHVSFN